MAEIKNIEQAFDGVLKNFQEAFKNHIDSTGHRATGKLGDSMTWETTIASYGYLITITLPGYAKYLEDGTKPHWPNIDAIKKWIEVKPILPRPLPNGKLPTTDQLAFLIGRKISKVGTPATHIIRDSMNNFQLVNKLYNVLSDAIKNEISKESLSAEIVG